MDRQSTIDLLLDHYENPRNYGAIENATFEAEGTNPGCGDVVHVYVQLNSDDRIAVLSFEGESCTISRAAASLMTEYVQGMSLDDVLQLDEDALVASIGREMVASRLKCVSLGLRTLQRGGQVYRNEQ